MLAILIAAGCSFAGRTFYSLPESDVDSLSDDIRLTEALVDEALKERDGLTPERASEMRSKVTRLNERLTELKVSGPPSSAGRILETVSLAAMVVSIAGNGVYIYRKATQ